MIARDQAKRAVAADGLPLADEGGFAVAEWRRDENRRAPVPTARPTAPARNAAMRNAPDREATAPERNLTIAERCGRDAERCISRASTVGAVDRAR